MVPAMTLSHRIWALFALALGGCSCNGNNSNVDSGPLIDVGPPPSIDPVEPLWQTNHAAARVKSPNQRMHYTVGLPFRFLADAQDLNAYQCPPGHPPYVCPDSSMAFFIDGQMVGNVPPSATDMNLWELRMPNGLTLGDHVLTVKFTPHAAAAVDGLVPIYIHVDPMPTHANMVSLSADLVLGGNTDLNWTDAVVIGNGHKVTAASGYSGHVIIHDSFVTGLASFDNKLGIDVTTTGGVDLVGSIFEATAPLHLVVNGSGPINITNNELRSTNYVTYESADPARSPILDLAGNTSGSKVMQGNNIGAGIVLITGMSNWQIGGLKDKQGNILIGPRCVLELESSSNAIIQGNYLHHDYYGGFSQGFNLQFGNGSDGALAEHNVIHDGSWPLQSFGGEFRYNLMINSGHDFIRSTQSGSHFHHNILAHAQASTGAFDGAMFVYSSEQNFTFDNNTVDAGGAVAMFDSPVLVLASSGVSVASLRNNVFSGFSDTNSNFASPSFVSGGNGEATVGAPRVAKADYNAWNNPLATMTGHYMPGIVSGTAGSHDVSGDPMFNGDVPQAPYQIDEGQVWMRQYGVSQVLSYYRAMYTPRAGSPLIDSGDPADGAGNDIGAIGAGTANAADKFGTVLDPN
jgi:hypothetical protein